MHMCVGVRGFSASGRDDVNSGSKARRASRVTPRVLRAHLLAPDHKGVVVASGVSALRFQLCHLGPVRQGVDDRIRERRRSLHPRPFQQPACGRKGSNSSGDGVNGVNRQDSGASKAYQQRGISYSFQLCQGRSTHTEARPLILVPLRLPFLNRLNQFQCVASPANTPPRNQGTRRPKQRQAGKGRTLRGDRRRQGSPAQPATQGEHR